MTVGTGKLTRRAVLKLSASALVGFSALGASLTRAAPAKASASQAITNVRWQFRGTADQMASAQAYLNSTFGPATGISVSIEPQVNSPDLLAQMGAGTAPDVFEAWRDSITQFSDVGYVVDVAPLAARDLSASYMSDFYPWQWQGFVLPGGMRFGMPKFVNMMVVWYNVDMFKRAGLKSVDDSWTHDTYAAAARQLTSSPTNVVGLLYYPWSWDRYWYKVEEWGGHVVDPADYTHCTLDSDAALAALEWSRKLMWDDLAMAKAQAIVTNGVDLFAAGRVAMAEDGMYPAAMAQAIGGRFKWRYAHVPSGPVQRRALVTSDGFSIWSGSAAQDASWELLKFLSNTSYQQQQTVSTGLVPARRSLLNYWKNTLLLQYPELGPVNLDIFKEALKMNYLAGRELFRRDALARDIIQPALDHVFRYGDSPVTIFRVVAQQVTDAERAP